MESEAEKNETLEAKIAELEAALARKQMELDYEKRYNIELKKYVDKETKKSPVSNHPMVPEPQSPARIRNKKSFRDADYPEQQVYGGLGKCLHRTV